MSGAIFKYYFDNPELQWVCSLCSLPRVNDSFFQDNKYDGEMSESNGDAGYANQDPPNSQWSSNNEPEMTIINERKNNSSEALIMHLNINSIQNKFEELKLLNDAFKAHVVVISETKIDSSYPNSQFNLHGYHMYRKDRVKGGGGLIAYFSSLIPSRKLALPRSYKTLEALAVESKIGRNDIIFLALYRPPKQSGNTSSSKYFQRVEEEINDICLWASFQKQSVVIVGDLNMDRLKPNHREGKILKDLEEVHDLQCMISEPTRITVTSQTLLDVLLTNAPQLFKKCGTYDPGISDHRLVYGVMTEHVRKHRPKTITFRDMRNIDVEQLNRDLTDAP